MKICKILRYSRQAYYKRLKSEYKENAAREKIKMLVQSILKKLPKIGTRKLLYLIRDDFDIYGIKCGRDKLFKYLREMDLLIKPKKRYVKTTYSKHWLHKYPDIFKAMSIGRPEEAFVSDITYLQADDGHYYLSLVTDVYSRKIVGYQLSRTMFASETEMALKLAIKSRIYPNNKLIHHSDRGLQYCSKQYVETAQKANISMSMTETSSPYDNALAERMNKTLKEEFNLNRKFKNFSQAYQTVKEAVFLYNNFRPHLALNYLTPDFVHKHPQLLGAIGD